MANPALYPKYTDKMVHYAIHEGIPRPDGLNVKALVWGPAHKKLAAALQKAHHLKDQSGNPTPELINMLFPAPKPKHVPKREKAVHAAMTQLGVTEHPPGSNSGTEVDEYIKAGEGFVIDESWCGDFVKWCSDKAGIHLPKFYYPRAVAWAENLPHVEHAHALLGDVVVFRWTDGTFHVSRFLKFIDTPSGQRVQTVDGNRSNEVGIFTTDVAFIHAIVRTPE